MARFDDKSRPAEAAVTTLLGWVASRMSPCHQLLAAIDVVRRAR